jgi:hypothetical protein
MTEHGVANAVSPVVIFFFPPPRHRKPGYWLDPITAAMTNDEPSAYKWPVTIGPGIPSPLSRFGLDFHYSKLAA